jgi:hypothetical protein
VDEVARTEVQNALVRFRDRFPDAARYQRFLSTTELTEDELSALLARGLRVQRYLDSRVGRTARVSEDEVDGWLRDRGETSGSLVARDVARARVAEEKARAQVRQLLADLRGRAEIRVLDPALREGRAP